MLCLWTDGHNKWFLAKITKVYVEDNTYDVFFPVDSEKLDRVKSSSLKNVQGTRSFKHQKELVGKVFYDSGSRKSLGEGPNFRAGRFTVLSASFDEDSNSYICHCERTKFTGDDKEEVIPFDLYYVMKRVEAYEQE